MNENSSQQSVVDAEHLRLLSLFHYIAGGINLAISLLIALQMVFFYGIMNQFIMGEMHRPFPRHGNFGPAIFEFILFVIVIFMILFIVFSILQILSGTYLKARKNRIFSFVIAIISLLSFPYGTILGVMTLIVLNRISVIELYKSETNQ